MNRVARRADWLATAGAVLVVGAFLLPIVWVVETALKTKVQSWSLPPHWFFRPDLGSFRAVLGPRGFEQYLEHSAIIAAGSTSVSLVLGSLAAYGFERHRRRIFGPLFLAFLFVYMIPELALALPAYFIAVQLGLLDTYVALIAMHATFGTAFAKWMLRGFFAEVPRECEESARVDGAGPLTVFLRVALPLAAPGLVATAIFCLIFSWNDYPYALLLSSLHTETLPLAIGQLKTPSGTAWGEIMAAATIAFLPTAVFTFLVQKWLIRGLSFGAVK